MSSKPWAGPPTPAARIQAAGSGRVRPERPTAPPSGHRAPHGHRASLRAQRRPQRPASRVGVSPRHTSPQTPHGVYPAFFLRSATAHSCGGSSLQSRLHRRHVIECGCARFLRPGPFRPLPPVYSRPLHRSREGMVGPAGRAPLPFVSRREVSGSLLHHSPFPRASSRTGSPSPSPPRPCFT